MSCKAIVFFITLFIINIVFFFVLFKGSIPCLRYYLNRLPVYLYSLLMSWDIHNYISFGCHIGRHLQNLHFNAIATRCHRFPDLEVIEIDFPLVFISDLWAEIYIIVCFGGQVKKIVLAFNMLRLKNRSTNFLTVHTHECHGLSLIALCRGVNLVWNLGVVDPD